MKVRWTETAVSHLASIHDYIAQDSPTYARLVVERLLERSEQIADFPHAGRSVPEYDRSDVREIVAPPFRIIYRLHAENADILAVLHGAQRLI